MKAIQFTIDDALLRRVDADPDVKAKGRSAFLRRAVEEHLRRKRDSQIRDSYRRGYATAPPARDEFHVSAEALAWPDE